MISLIKEFGRLRFTAAIISALPLVTLPLLGSLWLWESGWLWYWLGGLLVCGAGGYGLHRWAVLRDQSRLPEQLTHAAEHWPLEADACWLKVENIAAEATPEQWPLNDGGKLWALGQHTLETVARYYHPKRDQPLLELTLPHALAIIERAAREFRQDITEHIPFSHRLSLGSLARAKRWKDLYEQYESWYRVGRAVLAPQSAIFSELRRNVGNQIMDYGSERIQTWLLREYIRKVGYHAIELYSGVVVLDDGDATRHETPDTKQARQQADELAKDKQEPLNIVIAGHANAGKSSLINALFGELTAATDLLADTTTEVSPYRLRWEDETEALIFDTPGCDTGLFRESALKKILLKADLILWVSAANRADRDLEHKQITLLKKWMSDPSRRPPPLLVAMSHIDRLRPVKEWQPPYDLIHPNRPKAENILAALGSLSDALAIPVDQIIPVCLEPSRLYNVEDALWAAILSHQDDANRVRFLRCLSARQREENWQLIWRQLNNTGRLLLELPKRL